MGLVWSGFRLARRAARALRGAAVAGRGAGLGLRDGLDEANRLGGGRRDERLVERLWHARRAVRASSLAQRSRARKRAYACGQGSMGWVIIPGERSMDTTAVCDADGRCVRRRPLVSPLQDAAAAVLRRPVEATPLPAKRTHHAPGGGRGGPRHHGGHRDDGSATHRHLRSVIQRRRNVGQPS